MTNQTTIYTTGTEVERVSNNKDYANGRKGTIVDYNRVQQRVRVHWHTEASGSKILGKKKDVNGNRLPSGVTTWVAVSGIKLSAKEVVITGGVYPGIIKTDLRQPVTLLLLDWEDKPVAVIESGANRADLTNKVHRAIAQHFDNEATIQGETILDYTAIMNGISFIARFDAFDSEAAEDLSFRLIEIWKY